MKAPLKPTIECAGQRYFDEPIYVNPKRPNAIHMAVREALKSTEPLPQPIIVDRNRVRLNWIHPSTTT